METCVATSSASWRGSPRFNGGPVETCVARRGPAGRARRGSRVAMESRGGQPLPEEENEIVHRESCFNGVQGEQPLPLGEGLAVHGDGARFQWRPVVTGVAASSPTTAHTACRCSFNRAPSERELVLERMAPYWGDRFGFQWRSVGTGVGTPSPEASRYI